MKRAIWIIIVIVIVAVLGFVFMRPAEAPEAPLEPSPQEVDPPAEEDTTPTDSEEMPQSEGEADAWSYTIGSGGEANGSTAEYEVQKEFFGKPTENVIGVGSGVTGSIAVDAAAETFSFDATVDPATFKSGSDSRDRDVAGYFGGLIEASIDSYMVEGIASGDELAFTLPMEVTMNGVTRTIPFEVSASATEERALANGEATINMTDFGITPPSTAGIYTVNEAVVLRFTIFAN